MIKIISISLPPSMAVDDRQIKKEAAMVLGINQQKISGYILQKKSVDARSRHPIMVLQLEVFIDEAKQERSPYDPQLKDVTHAPHIVIAGAGPAGLFAALRMIASGIKPILVERGKDVRNRRRDLAAMNKQGVVHAESNYCFGEGGAGTYSDGKLYTRATKRGNVQRILELFHYFGADESILYEAHPHIGTNKLPQIIQAMREQIVACGGEVLFEKKLTDIVLNGNTITGVKTADGSLINCNSMILATGHSARDIFTLLHSKKIAIESKPFALGVRIEHPQLLIDQAQYHCNIRDPYLPPASYSLVSQEYGRGVFSFCMCPGGIIAPAATADGEIVVNGWSPSKRDNPFANSGTVATVDEHDFEKYGFTGPLAAMQYQHVWEQKAFTAGGGKLVAPAQRLTDFIDGRASSTLPACSYLPGISSVKIDAVLPKEVSAALKKAIQHFGKKMKGYYTNEAVLVATESRTSSPVRIPRDKESLQHTQIKGLYPCGEGAGYAGGIVSAAIDGERCAEAAIAAIIHK